MIKKFNEMNTNKYDITCIGYKTSAFGDRLWYYKMNHNDNEYCICEAGLPILLDMIWTEENTFEDSDLGDTIMDELDQIIPTIPKVQKELDTEDGENKFFTQHTIKPKVEPIKPARTNNHFSYREMNSVLGILSWFGATDDGAEEEITQEYLDYAREHGYDDLMDCLLGYTVSCDRDGNHKNDGQMVEYSLTFVSPSGKATHFSTEMCLMVGWNNWNNVVID